MRRIVADVQVVRRSLRRVDIPWLLAVFTIAAGVSATAAGFALVRQLLLVPLPVQDAASIVVAWPSDSSTSTGRGAVSLGEIATIEQNRRSIVSVAPVHQVGASGRAALVNGSSVPLAVAHVGGRFFEVLGVNPQVGRLLVSGDDSGRDGTMLVLSDAVWRREFGADPKIVGRLIVVSGTSYTVVGVAPRRFEYPAGTEGWVPMLAARPELLKEPDARWATLVARVRVGASPADARAELQRSLAPATVTVRPFAEVVIGDFRATVLLLSSAGVLVLLIASVNVAGASFSHSLARRHELAVRAALGAPRGALMRQLIVENGVIVVLGGGLGIAGAVLLLRVLRLVSPRAILEAIPASVDPVVIFSGLLAIVIALPLAVVWPAVAATHSAIEQGLRSEGRGIAGGRDRHLREIFVFMQFALTVVVVATAALLIRSLDRLQHQDIGYGPERLLFVSLEPLPGVTPSVDLYAAGFAIIRDALVANPQVARVSVATREPISGGGLQFQYWLESQADASPSAVPEVDAELAGSDHFRTLGMRLLHGRGFDQRDREGGLPVVVVSESFALRHWPAVDPIGQRIRVRRGDAWRTVIGVVGEVRYRDFLFSRPTIYLPAAQAPALIASVLVIQTRGAPEGLIPTIRAVVRDADPRFGIRTIRSGNEILAVPLARPRFLSLTLTALALSATLIAVSGLVAMMLAAVRQRRAELAVRIAVGATPAQVRNSILRRSVLVVGPGMVVGVALAAAVSQVFRSTLYYVSPVDPLTYAATCLGLLFVAVLAALIPAYRAARTDPGLALHNE